MFKAYKYIPSQFARPFLDKGVIRIGTIYEYRNIEKYGSTIGDDNEGIVDEKETYENLTIRGPEETPELLKGRIHVEEGGLFQMYGGSIVVREQSPDYYIFCITKEYNYSVMQEFKCDTCIEIFNIERFIQCLNKSMRHKGKFIGAFECAYKNKTVSPGDRPQEHPAIIKALEYAPQKEIRLIWEPKKSNPKPLILKCRKATKYCRNISLS